MKPWELMKQANRTILENDKEETVKKTRTKRKHQTRNKRQAKTAKQDNQDAVKPTLAFHGKSCYSHGQVVS